MPPPHGKLGGADGTCRDPPAVDASPTPRSMTMESCPRVSVVIPTYQRRLSVERTLQALSAQTMPADQFEVVVSIDGSMDGTREMLDACRTPYTLVAQWQRNRGRAAACNRGVALARGDVIVLLDDDMEPTPW